MTDAEQETECSDKDLSILDDFYWPGVGIGFLVSLILTAAIGIPLLVIFDSSWLFALISMASLFLGAFIAARMAGTSEPLNGVAIVLLHFFTLALVFFIGQAAAVLPEPLPGLDASDSTFFFSWPLGQLVLGTVGALVGGLGARGK